MSLQIDLFRPTDRTAAFSRSRIYRYELWRRWADGGRYVNFICLNPSTADEHKDDPTVRKCVKFARTWGYGAMCITNLFAYRATDRSVIKKVADPVGLDLPDATQPSRWHSREFLASFNKKENQ